MLSCSEGHLDIVKYLLEAGSDVRRQAKDGADCAYWASQNNHVEILDYIIPKYPDLTTRKLFQGRRLLHAAAWKGSLGSAIYILKNGGVDTLNKEDSKGNTPLTLAAYYGRLAMVKFLVQSGSDIRHVGWQGKTALKLANIKRHTKIVGFLKKHENHQVFRPIIQ